jgi:hypothetical protein
MDTPKLDPSKISIISAKKVDTDKLINFGDRIADKSINKESKKEKKCSLCCALAGVLISSCIVPALCLAQTRVAVIYHSNIKYTTQGLLRHAGWLSLPSIAVAGTLHFMLSENMWSHKRHSFGQAWFRAVMLNVLMWSSAVGVSTFFWRKVLPNIMKLRPYYFKYPIPSVPVDVRLVEDGGRFWTGMGASYFLIGLLHGQMGFAACVWLCVSYNRIYMFMSPHGKYARACLPMAQRELVEGSVGAVKNQAP